MQHPSFPIHRKLANDRALFRIHSHTRFTEVQRVGRHYVVHEVIAHIYPEKLKIAELIQAQADWVKEATSEEFEHWLSKANH